MAVTDLGESAEVFSMELEGFILASGIAQEVKRAKAAEVEAYWKEIGPVRGDKPTHGRDGGATAYGTNWPDDYVESIKVEEDLDGVVRVGSDLSPLAGWLEWGSIHNPEHGYGARVLAHFGGGEMGETEVKDVVGLLVG